MQTIHHVREASAMWRPLLRFSLPVGVVMCIVVATGLVLLGGLRGYSIARPRLLSGAAWLPSSAVGQLALLDGWT